MNSAPIRPGCCPVCGSSVEGKLSGIWSGYDKARGRGCCGPGYAATCKQCGTKLESFLTNEEADAGLFSWEVREPRVHVKQHQEVETAREAILKPLLETHAERENVTQHLGLKFADYSIDGGNRSELQKWFFLDEINEAAARFPGILFHIDATTMTWLFFDAEQRLRGYFIRSV